MSCYFPIFHLSLIHIYYIKDIYVWCFVTHDAKNNLYKVNIRSKGPIINEIASKYHGGGHKYASGVRTSTVSYTHLPVPLIVAFSKAIRLATVDLDKRENFIKRLNEKIVNELKKYDGIKINQTKICIPQILNISFDNIKAETFLHALEEYEIYVSTTTECSSGEISPAVMAVYNDKKRASSTLRIILSYLTTTDERCV